jgi:hypothetical protein
MSADELVGHLRQLADLHDAGAITDEEFTSAKRRVLGGTGGPAADAPARAVRRERPPGTSSPAPATADHARPAAAGREARSVVVEVAVLGGGLVSFLAFAGLPLAEVPFLGGATGWDLARLAGQDGALALLWFVLLAAVAVIAIGGWMQVASSISGQARRAASALVLAITCAAVSIYVLLALIVQARIDRGTASFGIDVTDLVGVGFWVGIAGMIVAGGGGVIDRVAIGSARTPAAPGTAPRRRTDHDDGR